MVIFLKTNKDILTSIQNYISINYVEDKESQIFEKDSINICGKETFCLNEMIPIGLDKPLKRKIIDIKPKISWQQSLFQLIDKKEYKDSDVYKKSYVSKQTFSKIRKSQNYHPDKDTAIKLCLGLELDINETNDLLSKSGYTLSPSIKRDLVIKYFIENKEFNIMGLNDVLYDLDLPLLPI